MFRSDDYLEFIRGRVCAAPSCTAAADHAHHFAKRFGGGGIGCKPHDTFVVPLCAEHHHEVHQHGGLRKFGYSRLDSDVYFFRVALQLVTQYLERKAA